MSIAQTVYDALISRLRAGAYHPGDRMPAEDIAQSFRVSRTPVREALSRLQERGLLEMTSTGLAVTRLEQAEVVELYALREILEGSAARFAAQHASSSDLFALRHIAGAFAACTDAVPRVAELNRRFHAAIEEAAHNRYLRAMLAGMHDTLMLLPSTTFAVPGRQARAVAEHGGILDAIAARDPDLAERLARDHIRAAREARLALMFTG